MPIVAVRCHRCGADTEAERIGVRDVCARCAAYLHCCRNCDHFRPAVRTGARATPGDARSHLEALFKKR